MLQAGLFAVCVADGAEMHKRESFLNITSLFGSFCRHRIEFNFTGNVCKSQN